MKITPQQLSERYAALPENLQEAFDSDETAVTLMNLGKKYALHVDQIGQLTTMVHYVLLGFLSPQDFPRELKSSLGIAEDTANLIIYDLNQQILSKIRAELEEVSQRPSQSREEQVNPPSSSSAPQIFDQKMTSVANVPKQEVAVMIQTGDNKIRDPYREPI